MFLQCRIEHLKRKCIHKRKKQVLKTHKRKKQVLKKNKHVKYIYFQKDYVMVPADKASNNIIVICKGILSSIMLLCILLLLRLFNLYGTYEFVY